MNEYMRNNYNSAIGALQNIEKVDCIYEDGTPNKYKLDKDSGLILKHDGFKWEASGFPLTDEHKFYSLMPVAF